jgi:pimeloyl-ACP methyl ester carboxylesterase
MLRGITGILLWACIVAPAGASGSSTQPPTLDDNLVKPQLTDIGAGRRLNAFCIGTGSPTVVFEQGGEGNIGNWKSVAPAISSLTRTCFYDRAGFGYSDPPRLDVTAMNVTDDLHALIQAQGIVGPVVLVGHSVGGFYATVYADRFPENVAGLVLVDPGFAGQEQWRTARDQESEFPHISQGEETLLKCARLARAGQLTFQSLAPNGCFPVSDQLPTGETRYLLHAVTGPHWYEAEYSQSVNFFSRDTNLSVSQAQEAAVRRSFGSMPIEVVSAENPPSSSWQTPERRLAAGAHWHEGHRQLSSRSTQGHWAVVEGAGHFIQRDQPQAVISAIERVIEKVRDTGSD